MRAAADVLIAGGGAIGCALALELMSRGAEVRVIDPGGDAGSATAAAGGMLAPLAEARQPGPFLEIALWSAQLYPGFVARIEQLAGADVAYRGGGKLQIARTESEALALRERHEWAAQLGHDVRLVAAPELHALEPRLAEDALLGLHIAGEHRVDARALGAALYHAVDAAGARVAGRVGSVLTRSGKVGGVELDTGEQLEAVSVVVAAGCWSGRIEGLPHPLPVAPVRGQMLALHAPDAVRRVIQAAGCYVIPRDDGRLIVGSTMEHAGYDAEPTTEGITTLLGYASAAVPALGDAPLLDAWAGLRPATPDELPVLGADPDQPGLFYATGHFRNGILLAPATALLVSDGILGATPAVDLLPFSVSRFR